MPDCQRATRAGGCHRARRRGLGQNLGQGAGPERVPSTALYCDWLPCASRHRKFRQTSGALRIYCCANAPGEAHGKRVCVAIGTGVSGGCRNPSGCPRTTPNPKSQFELVKRESSIESAVWFWGWVRDWISLKPDGSGSARSGKTKARSLMGFWHRARQALPVTPDAILGMGSTAGFLVGLRPPFF